MRAPGVDLRSSLENPRNLFLRDYFVDPGVHPPTFGLDDQAALPVHENRSVSYDCCDWRVVDTLQTRPPLPHRLLRRQRYTWVRSDDSKIESWWTS